MQAEKPEKPKGLKPKKKGLKPSKQKSLKKTETEKKEKPKSKESKAKALAPDIKKAKEITEKKKELVRDNAKPKKKRTKALKPIIETLGTEDEIEEAIARMFRQELFLPLMRAIKYNPGLDEKKIENKKKDIILDAIAKGRLHFNRGTFSGKLSSTLTSALRKIGAKYDRKTGTYKILKSNLPKGYASAIAKSYKAFEGQFSKIDKQLSAMTSEKMLKKVSFSDFFSKEIFSIDQRIRKDLPKAISVLPKLSKKNLKEISQGYSDSLEKHIKDFSDKEIKDLRERVKENALKGGRYEELTSLIQKRYNVSKSKARFLARQETNLMVAEYKKTRYKEAGVTMYRWKTVSGSSKSPVRDSHKKVANKLFLWDDPREVDESGNYKKNGARKPGNNLNPKEDYQCRCYPEPVVQL